MPKQKTDLAQRLRAHPRRGKVFCLSMQRSGTTSVGDWLESHGLARAGFRMSSRLQWSRRWLEGDFDAIFSSDAFEQNEVFEDDPWWCPQFFQVVAERYPDAKFVLLERDPDIWFESLCHHSGGRNPGWTDIHARIYGREAELQEFLRAHPDQPPDTRGLLSIIEHGDLYKSVYRRHYEAVRSYFKNQPQRLLDGRLGDPSVFVAMCEFVGVPHDPDIPIPHSNARTEEMKKRLAQYVVGDGR